MVNILLLPLLKRNYLAAYFKEAAGENGKVHAGATFPEPAIEAADFAYLFPPPESGAFPQSVLDYCKANKISAVVPLDEPTTAALSGIEHEFNLAGVTLLSGTHEMVNRCMDKHRQQEWFATSELHSPKIWDNVTDFLQDLRNGSAALPAIVKPRFGAGSEGVFEAETEEDLSLFFRAAALANTPPVNQKIDKPLQEALIQEKISGTEYALEIINDLQGNCRAVIPQKKLGMAAGEANPVLIQHDEALIQLGTYAGRMLKHKGAVTIDCIVTESKAYFIDINPHWCHSYAYTHLAGADLPGAVVLWLQGKEAPDILFQVSEGFFGFKEVIARIWKHEPGGANG